MSAIKRVLDHCGCTPETQLKAARTELAGYTETMACGHRKADWVEAHMAHEGDTEHHCGPDCGYCKVCREIEKAVERERDKYGKEIIHFEGFRYRRLLPATVHPGESVEEGPEVFSQAEIEREVAGAYEAAAQFFDGLPCVCDICEGVGGDVHRIDCAKHSAFVIRSLDSSAAARGKQAIWNEGWLQGKCDTVTACETELLHPPSGGMLTEAGRKPR